MGPNEASFYLSILGMIVMRIASVEAAEKSKWSLWGSIKFGFGLLCYLPGFSKLYILAVAM